MDDLNFDETTSSGKSFFTHLPAPLTTALLFAIPFIIVDFFNYYSAGLAQTVSFPILVILYAACGAVAVKLADLKGSGSARGFVTGASAGLLLWVVSTLVNTIIGLIMGTLSMGGTLLLGIPYLCLCAPLQLLGGSVTAGLGGMVYRMFRKPPAADLGEFYG